MEVGRCSAQADWTSDFAAALFLEVDAQNGAGRPSEAHIVCDWAEFRWLFQNEPSRLKEYPAPFSAGLALAVTDQLEYELRRGRVAFSPSECSAALYSWIKEAEVACGTIRSDGHWLPDYQPDPH